MAAGGLLGIVGDLHGDGHHEVEVVERAAGPRRAGREVTEELVGVLGQEGVAEPAVGELAGELEVLRTERGDVDRDRDRRQHRTDRPARPVGQAATGTPARRR